MSIGFHEKPLCKCSVDKEGKGALLSLRKVPPSSHVRPSWQPILLIILSARWKITLMFGSPLNRLIKLVFREYVVDLPFLDWSFPRADLTFKFLI